MKVAAVKSELTRNFVQFSQNYIEQVNQKLWPSNKARFDLLVVKLSDNVFQFLNYVNSLFNELCCLAFRTSNDLFWQVCLCFLVKLRGHWFMASCLWEWTCFENIVKPIQLDHVELNQNRHFSVKIEDKSTSGVKTNYNQQRIQEWLKNIENSLTFFVDIWFSSNRYFCIISAHSENLWIISNIVKWMLV